MSLRIHEISRQVVLRLPRVLPLHVQDTQWPDTADPARTSASYGLCFTTLHIILFFTLAHLLFARRLYPEGDSWWYWTIRFYRGPRRFVFPPRKRQRR